MNEDCMGDTARKCFSRCIHRCFKSGPTTTAAFQRQRVGVSETNAGSCTRAAALCYYNRTIIGTDARRVHLRARVYARAYEIHAHRRGGARSFAM